MRRPTGRVYVGAGAPCSPDPCGIGACCQVGSCVVTLGANCLTQGGVFLNAGSDCTGDPCAADGPCCLSGGPPPPGCRCADLDDSGDLTQSDVGLFVTRLLTAGGQPCP